VLRVDSFAAAAEPRRGPLFFELFEDVVHG
jgi:hypothetical protein